MSALFGKQSIGVDYAGEAAIPDTNIDAFTVNHDSLPLMEMQKIISQVGGVTTGELTLHSNGDTLTTSDFEDITEDMEENHA